MQMRNLTIKPFKNNNLNTWYGVTLQRNKNRVMLRANQYRWVTSIHPPDVIRPCPPSSDPR